MAYKINFLNDYLFRRVFGNKNNSKILLSLINAILEPHGFTRLTSISSVDPNLEADSPGQKRGVLDVQAVDSLGRYYDIEVQVSNEPDYIKRTLFYIARMYSRQIKAGEEYGTLKPCIGISILDFILFKEEEHFHEYLQCAQAFLLTER